jgi:hypothetical protein
LVSLYIIFLKEIPHLLVSLYIIFLKEIPHLLVFKLTTVI